ncbi:MAG: phosphate ABC transporter substrate-binding protein PstS [Thermoplasmata archaeon]|nr:phosphate ABC transporter substrate-binding protein PstS [Thermoplasmata archaeon]
MNGQAYSVPAAGIAAPTRRPVVRRRPRRGGWVALSLLLALVVVVVGAGYAFHWYGPHKSIGGRCPSGVTLQGNGAQFIQPLVAQWASAFDAESSNSVNYVAGGSGTGITDLSSRIVDFAATDDPLSPSQHASLPSAVLTFPVTEGSLVIVYNLPGVNGHLNLSGAVLADIYLGKVTRWNDPAIEINNSGVSLPASTIQTVHRSDPAGTTFVLSDFLSQESPAWASGPGKGIGIAFPTAPAQSAPHGNAALLTYVEATRFTIGYTDLTDVLTATNPPSYAAILNPRGHYIVPTLASTASAGQDIVANSSFPSSDGNWYNVSLVNAGGATDYPVVTLAYLFAFQATDRGFAPSLAKSTVLVAWFNWVLTTGQASANANDFATLPASLVSVDQAGLSTMTFNGASLPICS